MIVSMQRLTLLCLAAEREKALAALRELGVVHLVPVQPSEGRDVDELRARLNHIRRVLEVLPAKPGQSPSGQPGSLVVDRAWQLLQQKRELEESLEDLRQERHRLAPFGNFDPASLLELKKKGVVVKLVYVPLKKALSVPEGVVVHPLGQDLVHAYFALLAKQEFSVDAVELKLPELPLSELDRRITDLEAKLLANGDALWSHAGDQLVVRAEADAAEEAIQFLEARDTMGHAGPVSYVQGYVPGEAVESLRGAAAREGWGLLITEPTGDEPVPTLIRNPVWVKPIKAVLDFIGVLPGYTEIDISAAFMFFLSLFFAMLVGDAGYGLILLGLTWWLRRKFATAPAYPFHLLYIMSFATVLWGAVTGSWFGAGHLPTFLENLTVAWLREPKNIMLLSFLIGSIHLTIAHLWIISRTWNSPKALAQVGWIGSTWTMFFMARNLVLGFDLPGWIGPVFLVSVVLIILFMTAPRDFKNEWFNHVMLPLNLVSNFVDVVSYIRLFAVGTAGYAVASSFNKMILGGGVEGVLAGLLAALLLFLGHALNLILCAMGVLVHGVRLNTLEFSSHIGMAWTGLPYRPFQRITRKQSEP
jgi:V/A-type H+-transporting ATPase subunit I